MTIWQDFHGPNAAYVLELYERYRRDPNSVDEATRAYFDQAPPPAGPAAPVTTPAAALDKVVAVANLAQAIRDYGHLLASIDPLGSEPPGDPCLDLSSYGLTGDDLRQLPAGLVGGPAAEAAANALEAIESLRHIYSGAIGYDYEHLRLSQERDWLRNAAESRRFFPEATASFGRALLEQLTQVEVFEHFLQRTFPGKTRFSVEGLDMMVPILNEIIGSAAEAGIYNISIGMAHRGRLNVLAHVLHKPYTEILAEFKDPVSSDFATREDLGWTGDVKYHSGARRAMKEGQPIEMVVSVAPNPSHLEHINPVVLGMARAAGVCRDEPGLPCFDPAVSIPVLIHGDAAFAGQGIVAETLNLYRLPGYTTGGAIHIIANNQLGFTTGPAAGRSTLYASDLAKGFKIPILHVNADDPEACIAAACMAFAYLREFRKDFLIDLVGYRRYGHNEGDEPAFTQPLVYRKVQDHPTVRAMWAGELTRRDQVGPDLSQELYNQHMEQMQQVLETLQPEQDLPEPQLESPPPGAARQVDTTIPLDRLRELNQALTRILDGFNLNSKLKRLVERRQSALAEPDEAAIDWGTAEQLAMASIVAEGTPIRFTGQDAERGTFSHRHAVWHDVETGDTVTPLQLIPQARASFEIINTPLSENAALAFEYGYNIQAPGHMVIWEAQYGDFINGAQAIIDEFIVSGRAKWEQTSSLVLLLPHGYEGQGPDHSSGRLERFLQLAAETNMRIANCTTAAQYFHLLRRQAALLKIDPLPLVVMSPKSLLRHRRAASTPRELAEGRWQPVIDDAQARQQPEQVRRLIWCSGKVYVDLVSSDFREQQPDVAIARLEQLYRFPVEAVEPVLAGYPNLEEVVWLQEEPENMGAWDFVQPQLRQLINGRWPLRYLGRPRRASPAEGSASWHNVTQAALVERAYRLDKKAGEAVNILEKAG